MKPSLTVILTMFIVLCNNAYGEQCKVRDPDIQGYYSGGCANGYASGEGIAIGRDRYEGQFVDGDPHGYGTYSWGPTTEWAGDVYEGNLSMGERTGYGMYSSPEPTGYKYDTELDGRYVVQGVFRNSELKELCTSESACIPIPTRPESKKKSSPKSQWEFSSETDKFTDRITQVIATKSSNRLGRTLVIACSGGEMALVYQHSFNRLISDNDRAELIVRIDDNEVHRFRFSDLSFDGTMTATSINEEAKMIAEMKAGLEIAVQSSTRDLEISYEGSVEDVFSLIGFTAASRKLDCNQ